MAMMQKFVTLLVAAAITAATIGCGSSSGGASDPTQAAAASQNNADAVKRDPAGLTPKQEQVREASKGKDDD